MNYFIDTNVFLRTLVKEDEKSFVECYGLLEAVKTNEIKAATAGIVLAEVVWTLSSFYDLSKSEVVESLRSIQNLRGLKLLDEYDHRRALEMYSNHHVKYVDAVIASLPDIQSKERTIVSYDKDFEKLDVLWMEPGEVVPEEGVEPSWV